MAEISREERLLPKVQEMQRRFFAKMDSNLKGKLPFGMRPVLPEDRLFTFETMTPQDVENYQFQNGMANWNALAVEMDVLRRKLQIKNEVK